MKLPANVAYGWKECIVGIHDQKLKTFMQESLRSVSDPWQIVTENTPCIKVWRVNKLRASSYPIEVYGHFYQEEVFLVLHVERTGPKTIANNIYLWVGKYASQEDYRVGFQLVNQLDQKLKRNTILHREIQGFESKQFRSLFNPIAYWNGSFNDSYFMTHVRDDQYSARMLKMYKPNNHEDFFVAKEVPCTVEELDPAYTFILDTGRMFYLWHGNLTPTEDDLKCTRFVERMKADRGCQTQVEALDDDTEVDAHEFFTYLSRSKVIGEDEERGSTLHRESTLTAKTKSTVEQMRLYKIRTDQRVKNISLAYSLIKETKVAYKEIKKHPICFYSTTSHMFVVMQKKASVQESDIALQYGHDILKESSLPYRPVTIVRYNQKSPQLQTKLL